MTIEKKRFLFIPVSSVEGIGEYMRSMILASKIKQRWPDAEIKFILNQHAQYANDCPYETVLLESSPTKHVNPVNRVIENFKPDIVIFDASGRKPQLQKAKQVGAITVFISQHAKKRRRGMKWGRMKATDLHFVAQPEYTMPEIDLFSSFKCKLQKKLLPKCVGVVFDSPEDDFADSVLKQFQLESKSFIILNAGSGGHLHDGQLAADFFYEAAESLAENTNKQVVILMGPNYPKELPKSEKVRVISRLDNSNFISLISHSYAAVLSGGDTLLQALALNTPVIAVPVSKDQPARIAACEKKKIVKSVEISELAEKLPRLLDETILSELKKQMKITPSKNGAETIIEQLASAIQSKKLCKNRKK
ncbi:glycosyltransferase [Shewanella sp. 202IG2-18]|uniref:glycosyltransferase family 9 protein n=1 Tax=Parashewanella hymeniacidonis TaxID=2807618 RepID=UPI001960F1CE|nr:glycosyltransferase [Parashewanella hymeniacidonis]MBM7071092.1 glycosyltransferase [Parashewanella hymeniacidonis]